MGELKQVTIETIGGGVIPELFERELEAVLENIDDPNTDPKQARKITIEITFSPHESREMTAVTVKCNSKTAGVKPHSTVLHLVRQNKRMIALAKDPRQQEMFEKSAIHVIQTEEVKYD